METVFRSVALRKAEVNRLSPTATFCGFRRAFVERSSVRRRFSFALS